MGFQFCFSTLEMRSWGFALRNWSLLDTHLVMIKSLRRNYKLSERHSFYFLISLNLHLKADRAAKMAKPQTHRQFNVCNKPGDKFSPHLVSGWVQEEVEERQCTFCGLKKLVTGTHSKVWRAKVKNSSHNRQEAKEAWEGWMFLKRSWPVALETNPGNCLPDKALLRVEIAGNKAQSE